MGALSSVHNPHMQTMLCTAVHLGDNSDPLLIYRLYYNKQQQGRNVAAADADDVDNLILFVYLFNIKGNFFLFCFISSLLTPSKHDTTRHDTTWERCPFVIWDFMHWSLLFILISFDF